MEKKNIDNNPKITVITPTYNRANLIVETIESVLAQDYKDFEYLILDDGSTDNTEEIVRPYLKDKRVRYLKHANAGEAETANWGWSLAGGEYFTQVNSDDPILPGHFSEMVNVLDRRRNVVVAYPDFYVINQDGKIIRKEKIPDWNFLDALKKFSCYATAAGTFIRKSAFSDWAKIKNSKFKYINDVDMYWKMALQGDFYHVPKFLATWRVHSQSISSDVHKSIPEVEIWFREYFSKNNLPHEVLLIKEKVRKAINEYGISLLNRSKLDKKQELIGEYYQSIYKSENLQISDSDIIGNKFNGHDLHLYLSAKNIDSKQLVWNKESDDKNTFKIARNRFDRDEIYSLTQVTQKQYSLNGILNPIGYDILLDPLFLNTELVHLHLIHNHIFDIQLLPLMSRLKPIIWTLHDPWALGGHCIHHFECEKWKKHCGDCPKLDVQFGLPKDNSALNFALKKDAIKNSKLEIIVASRWMKIKVEQSAIFSGNKINIIPFGINQDIFKPINKIDARKQLRLEEGSLIISFRCDSSKFKGLDTIEFALDNIQSKKKIILLVLANKLRKNPKGFKAKEYGWVKDDKLLAQIYSASDLFLMPSTVEAFGMMAIEAMSCGTLPIVIDGTALQDTVNAPECGVATKRDKNSYLESVQYYIDNKNEREIRAKKCLEFARKNYNKDDYVSKIIAIYEEAKVKHKLTEADEYLLRQLKKNEILEKINNSEQLINNYKGKVAGNPFNLLKHYFILYFLKYKNIVPKRMRNIVRVEIRELLRWLIFKTSPTFRMLVGNRKLMNYLLEQVKNLEKLSKRNVNITNLKLAKIDKIYEKIILSEIKTKKILVIAMLNSIHTARWLSQFADDDNYEMHLFPVNSWKVHDLILNQSKFIIYNYDFSPESSENFNASYAIENIINTVKPDIVHTLEMQHSAYLVLPIKQKMGNEFPIWFYSCWGSDIKWFERFPEHKEKIVEVLNNCDALFSGDRDSIKKAIDEYGFNNPVLNVPSPGGYKVDYYTNKIKFILPSERKIILVKGYSGWVYRPDVVFAALKKCKDQLIENKMKVVVFLGGEVQSHVDEIRKLGISIEMFAHTNNYDDVMELYARSKISLYSSVSDGVPNSMLESMLMGCFPILSNSGSASEYITNGENGFLLNPEDVDGYVSALKKSLADNNLLDSAAEVNRNIIKSRLDYDVIKNRVLKFYGRFI